MKSLKMYASSLVLVFGFSNCVSLQDELAHKNRNEYAQMEANRERQRQAQIAKDEAFEATLTTEQKLQLRLIKAQEQAALRAQERQDFEMQMRANEIMMRQNQLQMDNFNQFSSNMSRAASKMGGVYGTTP